MIEWETSWAIIKATLPIWETYLFSKEIYFPLHVDGSLVVRPKERFQLSAGRLSLSLNFLSAWIDHDPRVREMVTPDFQLMLTEIRKWSANWEKKVEIEIPIRIRQTSRLSKEMRSGVDFSSAQFIQLVELRLMLELMIRVFQKGVGDHFYHQILPLDQVFRMKTHQSNFLWQPDLAKYYDPEKYWFLYRTIQ